MNEVKERIAEMPWIQDVISDHENGNRDTAQTIARIVEITDPETPSELEIESWRMARTCALEALRQSLKSAK